MARVHWIQPPSDASCKVLEHLWYLIPIVVKEVEQSDLQWLGLSILWNLGYIEKTQNSVNTGCLEPIFLWDWKLFSSTERGREHNLMAVKSQQILLAGSCANPTYGPTYFAPPIFKGSLIMKSSCIELGYWNGVGFYILVAQLSTVHHELTSNTT